MTQKAAVETKLDIRNIAGQEKSKKRQTKSCPKVVGTVFHQGKLNLTDQPGRAIFEPDCRRLEEFSESSDLKTNVSCSAA